MTLKEILHTGGILGCSLELDEKLSATASLSLEAQNDAKIIFTTAQSGLFLSGRGPFLIRGLSFHHDLDLAPSFVTAENALVIFEDCSFFGASGGSEENLAAAVLVKGDSRVYFERCHFENNDTHLKAEGNSSVEFRHCLLQEARADGVLLAGRAQLQALELEVAHSGWSGISSSGQAGARLWDSRFCSNGCHGLDLQNSSAFISNRNLFSENGQNGVALSGHAHFMSDADQYFGNSLCGLDLGDSSIASVQSAQASHNRSHGYQLRGQSQATLAACSASENLGSGLALFDQASSHSEDLQCEENACAGVQSANDSQVYITRANLCSNRSSGLVSFGKSRLVLERSRVIHALAHGLQICEDCHAVVRDCEIMDNQRAGILLAGNSRGLIEQNTLAHNGQDGLALADRTRVTVIENLIRSNARDGILNSTSCSIQVMENRLQSNGRYGIYAAVGSKALLQANQCSENAVDQVFQETRSGPEIDSENTSLSIEGSGEILLPFQAKGLEKSLLQALAKHGRLSEAALGKVAKTRRVGGAMENLIDRLNRAGMPLIRHEGQGPEGVVYALKLDTSRLRRPPGNNKEDTQTQGREIC